MSAFAQRVLRVLHFASDEERQKAAAFLQEFLGLSGEDDEVASHAEK